MVNAQRNVGAINSVPYPKNGSIRNRNTASIPRTTPPTQMSMAGPSEASALTFDYLGNIVEWSVNVVLNKIKFDENDE